MDCENPPEKIWCFECHKQITTNGKVLQKCANDTCHRYFHPKCAKNEEQREKFIEKWNYHKANFQKTLAGVKRKPGKRAERSLTKTPEENFNENSIESEIKYCYACTLLEKGRQLPEASLTKEELNYLLKFVVDRVISWVPSSTWGVAEIEGKVAKQKFTLLEELLVDILDMTHHVALTNGLYSFPYESCQFLFADALFEISEIYQCTDCYRHSNEKFKPNWFALPCSTKKHELVYAKMIGYSYWPAKVVKIQGDTYDVRFFGDSHSRYDIDKRFIKPINTNTSELFKGQMTLGLKNALKELDEHRKLLMQNPSQFSFEAEKEMRQNHTSGKKRKKSEINGKTDIESPVKRMKGRPSSSKNTASNGSTALKTSKEPGKVESPTKIVKLSHEDAHRLESKQRTRGDLQKIINTIEGTPDQVTPKPLNNKMIPSSSTSSVDSQLSSKKPKIGPKSVMERLAKEMPNSNEHSPEFRPPPKTPDRSDTTIDLTFTPDKNQPTSSEHSPDTNRSPRIKAQVAKEQNNTVFKLRCRLEPLQDVEEVKQIALSTLKKEVDLYEVRLNDLREFYERQISKIKKKSWCTTCEKQSIYYCCWNTTYCSKACQTAHWVNGHKTKCQNKRS